LFNHLFNHLFTVFCQLHGMKRAGILLLAAALAMPAFAAEKSEGGKTGGPAGTNVDLQYLMAPLGDADGKLLGYAYITARLTASSDSDTLVVRDKMPFIQDALVRDVNAGPVATAADPQKIDVPGVEARLLADARRVVGAARIKVVTVCTIQVALLHLAQTPSPAPPDAKRDVDEHGNPVKSRCEIEKPA
jgi:hypothetical protein